jgi:cysteine/glycine-rich protein
MGKLSFGSTGLSYQPKEVKVSTLGAPSCPRCNERVYFNEEKRAIALVWHTRCFTCATCKKRLDTSNVSSHDGEIFCGACHKKAFGPKGYGFAGGATGLSTESTMSKIRPVSGGVKTQVPASIIPATVIDKENKENCLKCGKKVFFAEEVKALKRKCHRLCFKCGSCNKMLEPGRCSEHEDDVYCTACYGRKFGPKGYGWGGGAGNILSSDMPLYERRTKRRLSATDKFDTNGRLIKSVIPARAESPDHGYASPVNGAASPDNGPASPLSDVPQSDESQYLIEDMEHNNTPAYIKDDQVYHATPVTIHASSDVLEVIDDRSATLGRNKKVHPTVNLTKVADLEESRASPIDGLIGSMNNTYLDEPTQERKSVPTYTPPSPAVRDLAERAALQDYEFVKPDISKLEESEPVIPSEKVTDEKKAYGYQQREPAYKPESIKKTERQYSATFEPVYEPQSLKSKSKKEYTPMYEPEPPKEPTPVHRQPERQYSAAFEPTYQPQSLIKKPDIQYTPSYEPPQESTEPHDQYSPIHTNKPSYQPEQQYDPVYQPIYEAQEYNPYQEGAYEAQPTTQYNPVPEPTDYQNHYESPRTNMDHGYQPNPAYPIQHRDPTPPQYTREDVLSFQPGYHHAREASSGYESSEHMTRDGSPELSPSYRGHMQMNTYPSHDDLSKYRQEDNRKYRSDPTELANPMYRPNPSTDSPRYRPSPTGSPMYMPNANDESPRYIPSQTSSPQSYRPENQIYGSETQLNPAYRDMQYPYNRQSSHEKRYSGEQSYPYEEARPQRDSPYNKQPAYNGYPNSPYGEPQYQQSPRSSLAYSRDHQSPRSSLTYTRDNSSPNTQGYVQREPNRLSGSHLQEFKPEGMSLNTKAAQVHNGVAKVGLSSPTNALFSHMTDAPLSTTQNYQPANNNSQYNRSPYQNTPPMGSKAYKDSVYV